MNEVGIVAPIIILVGQAEKSVSTPRSNIHIQTAAEMLLYEDTGTHTASPTQSDISCEKAPLEIVANMRSSYWDMLNIERYV